MTNHYFQAQNLSVKNGEHNGVLVCYTAVFSVVTQRSSPLTGEERCVTTLKTYSKGIVQVF